MTTVTGSIPPVSPRGRQTTSPLTVFHSLRLFVKVDGKCTPKLKEFPVRDGLRAKKGKDIGSKENTREVVQDREKGVKSQVFYR